MPIRFACPHCKVVVNAPGNAAGKKLPCPKCSLQLEVPTPKGELVIEQPAPQFQTAPPPVAPPPPAPDRFNFDQVLDHDEEEDYTPRKRRRNRGNGTAALVWALLGLFLFAPLGIVAIMVANQALREDYTDGTAKAALIIGWIDTICFLFGCCVVGGFFFMMFAGAAGAR